MSNPRMYENTITLVKVADGQSASAYFIETNYDEILKFETSKGLELSPAEITFQVLDLSRPQDSQVIENFDWSLSYLGKEVIPVAAPQEVEEVEENEGDSEKDPTSGVYYKTSFIQIAKKGDVLDDLKSAITTQKNYNIPHRDPSSSYDTLYLYPEELYNGILKVLQNSDVAEERKNKLAELKGLIEEETAVFKVVYKINEYAMAEKLLTLGYGLSADMAKLNIGAKGIVASVLDSSLEFNSQGLQLFNGDFVIAQPTYEEVTIGSQDDFDECLANGTIYKYGENYNYIKALSYIPGVRYFQASSVPVFYTEGENLTLKGAIYANSGEFHGDIYAQNGSFRGSLQALDGTIGGFTIGPKYFSATAKDLNDACSRKLFVLIDGPSKYYGQITHGWSDDTGAVIRVKYKDKYFKQVFISKFETGEVYYEFFEGNYRLVHSNEDYSADKQYFQEFEPFSSFYSMERLEVENLRDNEEYFGVVSDFDCIKDLFYEFDGQALTSLDETLILNGTTGLVKATNIELGEGARVAKHIIFSKVQEGEQEKIQAALYNPEIHQDNLFIQSAKLKINNSGLMQLGKIELFGGDDKQQAYIRTIYVDELDEINNGYWRINEDGSAYFDDISVNSATIKNAKLETETVQSVGSLMVFKDGWEIVGIKKIDGATKEEEGYSILELNKFASLKAKDWIWNGKAYYQISDEIIPKSYYVYDEQDESYISFDGTFFTSGDSYFERDEYGNYHLTKDTEPHSYATLTSLYKNTGPHDIIIKIGQNGKKDYVKNQSSTVFTGRTYYTKNDAGQYIAVPVVDKFKDGKEYYYQGITSPSDYIISILGETRENDDDGLPKESAAASGVEGNIGRFSVPNSLTISSFYIDEGLKKALYTKHLILGQLSSAGIDSIQEMTGFGLYADNVYLHGSLTTVNKDGKFAGIQTNNTFAFSKSPEDWEEKDTSRIVFWGGAGSLDERGIQEAPFQVTQKGTLYANRAVLTDSIFANGDIYSASIHTANIYGRNGALNIHADSSGIVFKDLAQSEIFVIDYLGIAVTDDGGNKLPVLQIDENEKASFYGTFISSAETIKTTGNSTVTSLYASTLSQDGLTFNSEVTQKSGDTEYNWENSGGLKYVIDADNNNNAILDFLIDSTSIQQLTKSEITNKVLTRVNNEFWLGGVAQHIVTDKGFDLYIQV